MKRIIFLLAVLLFIAPSIVSAWSDRYYDGRRYGNPYPYYESQYDRCRSSYWGCGSNYGRDYGYDRYADEDRYQTGTERPKQKFRLEQKPDGTKIIEMER